MPKTAEDKDLKASPTEKKAGPGRPVDPTSGRQQEKRDKEARRREAAAAQAAADVGGEFTPNPLAKAEPAKETPPGGDGAADAKKPDHDELFDPAEMKEMVEELGGVVLHGLIAKWRWERWQTPPPPLATQKKLGKAVAFWVDKRFPVMLDKFGPELILAGAIAYTATKAPDPKEAAQFYEKLAEEQARANAAKGPKPEGKAP